jgi:hypothetical protein
MEFPDLVLALIREYARPRMDKEARDAYKQVIQVYGEWPMLKRAMLCSNVVDVVKTYNRETTLIDDLQILYRELPLSQKSTQIRMMIYDSYVTRRCLGQKIRMFVEPQTSHQQGGYTY